MNAEHQRKVWAALDQLQQAQSLAGDAARQLCPLDGFAPDFDRLCRLEESIKAEWHRLNNHRIAAVAGEAVRP